MSVGSLASARLPLASPRLRLGKSAPALVFDHILQEVAVVGPTLVAVHLSVAPLDGFRNLGVPLLVVVLVRHPPFPLPTNLEVRESSSSKTRSGSEMRFDFLGGISVWHISLLGKMTMVLLYPGFLYILFIGRRRGNEMGRPKCNPIQPYAL